MTPKRKFIAIVVVLILLGSASLYGVHLYKSCVAKIEGVSAVNFVIKSDIYELEHMTPDKFNRLKVNITNLKTNTDDELNKKHEALSKMNNLFIESN